jgi:hypothetical protein
MDRLVINTVGPSVKKYNKRFAHSLMTLALFYRIADPVPDSHLLKAIIFGIWIRFQEGKNDPHK